ncbi:hypothetical protein EV191_101488 [Tamaricihabitans halophyticus]|uniref:Glutamate-cysteine ligase n=1 Tax=Tamaricihabitans halophyticus TaxID=1262583 RepID=A0A4R2RAU7_9PSEU|nr:glutamate--cysteine ligase [Tamaricihabitans halophyticus]TCP56545.1 hypothetical protein EV191_101488 [Tamaricihabitans halophyticus]
MAPCTGSAPEPFVPHQRQRYRRKVHRCLDALADMLTSSRFCTEERRIGLEIELNIVDETLRPSMANSVVLEKLNDPSFTIELSQHNLELNVPPRELSDAAPMQLERELHTSLANANKKAQDAGCDLALIGILPTLESEHFQKKWISNNPRYVSLNDQIVAVRGEQLALDIDGASLPGRQPEALRTYAESILPEAACTSLQLHRQVRPDEFAAYWNSAQCLAGVQLAIGANSPFLLGNALWSETRIPLFLQATDTRTEELRNQGVRPRVWFGERWITSVLDLFDENVRYFPGLIAEFDDEDPLTTLDEGNTPGLAELRTHNGTIWRWNRPVYDVVHGVPHLRVENRVLPAGPTVSDMVANAMFFYGAQHSLAHQERPLWTNMSFASAEENFFAAAKSGMDAKLYWPGLDWTAPDELVLQELLPLAREGLRAYGVTDRASEHYLGIIERRCLTRQNGASWQRDAVRALEDRGYDRNAALRQMFERYLELMNSGEPVHNWPIPR